MKGIDTLIRAWRTVEEDHPDWHLQVVGGDAVYHGSSGYRQEMIDLAQLLGTKRISFIPETIGAEKNQLFEEADLFILPSHSENFGVAVAEALSFGVPAIVTKGAPWSGLISRDAGWHVDNDVGAIAQAMKSAFGMPKEKLREMGWNGRTWMKEEFSWEKIAEMMMATYSWLIDHNSDRPACISQVEQ